MIRGLNKLTSTDGLGYVMSSYTSHPDGFDAAEDQALEIAATLTHAGLVVFVPIAYGPAIERKMSAAFSDKESVAYHRSHELWMPICERFFQRCDYAIIAMTPGWYSSIGIAIEYDYLTARGVPIYFYDVSAERILSWGEAYEEFFEEMEELEFMSEFEGTPGYLQAAHD